MIANRFKYENADEIRNDVREADIVQIMVNGMFVTESKNNKAIREQVYYMTKVPGMKCIGLTTYQALGRGYTDREDVPQGPAHATYWFVAPEYEEEIVHRIIHLYSGEDDRAIRTYTLAAETC